ncbi:hypothetical protein FIV00_24800 [Labrenzia sp. THAF82]|uniref:hypothetical protein n=1 Tax=Labrenzia sp. THAF82 TaxID=2587861 RepID=UPI001268C398|nr:hypothetical protein [Labrenzia sp. THAF82]QFT33737.1 hypothetical protein FIV00_24800 [Labrenzia sp. THAF82]
MRASGQTSRRPLPHAVRAPDRGPGAIAAKEADRPPQRSQQSALRNEASGPGCHSDDQIEKALVKALKSPEFQSAPQLRSFLGFVVRATLNDQREKIKGYTIAVEALGRPEDFNPVTDPIVRVEAARLRRRLEKYYEGSGSNDPVRIAIPKGSYTPHFFEPADKNTSGPERVHTLTIQFDSLATDTSKSLETLTRLQEQGEPVSGAKADPSEDQPGVWRELEISYRQLLRSQVPFHMVMVIGIACFLVGVLAATL